MILNFMHWREDEGEKRTFLVERDNLNDYLIFITMKAQTEQDKI